MQLRHILKEKTIGPSQFLMITSLPSTIRLHTGIIYGTTLDIHFYFTVTDISEETLFKPIYNEDGESSPYPPIFLFCTGYPFVFFNGRIYQVKKFPGIY
jgi:hypothetical protein